MSAGMRRVRLLERNAFRSSIENATRDTAIAEVAESLVARLEKFQHGHELVSSKSIGQLACALEG